MYLPKGCKATFLLSLFISFFSVQAMAHGDEIATDPGIAKDHFTAYGKSDIYELTLYYPELSAGTAADLVLYVADAKTNRPIDKAELKITATEDPFLVFSIKQTAAGVYSVEGVFSKNEDYTFTVQITHPNGADLIEVEAIQVGEKLETLTEHHAESDSGHNHDKPWLWLLGGILLGGLLMFLLGNRRNRNLTLFFLLVSAWLSVPFMSPVFAHGDEEHGSKNTGGAYGKTVYAPKETQFLFEILTQPISVGDYQSATTMFGTVVPASGGMGVVAAPQNGRISSVKVVVGQKVQAGQVVAILQQNINTSDQVGIAATNAHLAVQKETAQARVTATKREYERLKSIADIAAGRDVQAAEAAYNQAKVELQALENKAIQTNATANNRTISLVAPISGVVGAFTLSAGAEVVAGQNLLSITNLSKIYVEAQVYDKDLVVIQAHNKFVVTCATDDHKSVEVRLLSEAQSMNPGNQSQRVLFEMDNPNSDFKIGEFVTVRALSKKTSHVIAVPNSSLTEINGKTAIFIKHAPEEFELAYVQTGEDDGTRTMILKGLEEEELVVTSGTYEVKMMYLNR